MRRRRRRWRATSQARTAADVVRSHGRLCPRQGDDSEAVIGLVGSPRTPRPRRLDVSAERLDAAARLRIVVVHEPPDPKDFADQLCSLKVGDRLPKRPVKLAPLRDLLLTENSERAAWAFHSALAIEHGKGRSFRRPDPKRRSKDADEDPPLTELTFSVSGRKELLDRFGCFCSGHQLPLNTLVQQLDFVTSALEQTSSFSYASRLRTDLEQLLVDIESNLASAPDGPPERTFDRLAGHRCWPLRKERDASGLLQDGGHVLLVEPERLFNRLPIGAETMEEDLELYSLPRLRHELPMLEKAIGVREKPTLHDWVSALDRLGEAADGDLLPNDSKAAKFALERIIDALRTESEVPAEGSKLDLYSFVGGGTQTRLLPVGKLLWPDKPAFEKRCAGLGAHDLHITPGPFEPPFIFDSQYKLLSKFSALRSLSEVVTEAVVGGTLPGEPGESDSSLVELLASPELAQGYCACLLRESSSLKPDSPLEKVKEAFAAVAARLCWSPSPLRTALYVNGEMLEGSESETLAFVDAEGKLWLRATS